MKTFTLLLAGLMATGAVNAATLQRGSAASPALAAPTPTVLGAHAIAQMDDNTPVPGGAVACSDYDNNTTSSQSWWRRFYLAEHGAPSSVRIESVTVGAETGFAPVTIRLYAIPHSVPVGTIPLDQLQPIGVSQTIMLYGRMSTTTIPVVGLLADAVGQDLVVEYHTEGTRDSAFYPGGNPSTETHAAFLSAPDCGIPEPVQTGKAGFSDAHLIIVANAAQPGVSAMPSFTPATIAANATAQLKVALLNPLSSPATLTSAFGLALPPNLVVAPSPNASTTCGGSLVATPDSNGVSLNGATIPASGACNLVVDVTSSGGVFDLPIPVGALQTSQGANAQPASARLTVIPTGGNGLIRSGPLDRALAGTLQGSYYDMVGTIFNDTAIPGANWDLNFGLAADYSAPAVAVLGFRTAVAAEVVLDDQGRVAVLVDGDVVGPSSTFGSENLASDPRWYASTDAAVGVRFRCAGRLTYPVRAGDYCFGYIRLSTTAPAGIPARLIESAFQGDGDPITVQLGGGSNPPSASVSPAAISLSVAANAIAQQEFSLANAIGSLPLRYATGGRGSALSARPALADLARAGTQDAVAQRPPFAPLLAPLASAMKVIDATGFDPTPWTAAGNYAYALDDGVYEKLIGLGSDPGIWLNRYSVIEAQTINSISVMWPTQPAGGSVLGLPVNLLVYYDADGNGDPRNAVRLGDDEIVSIDTLDRFQTYPTQFEVPAAGDIYIGFVEHWAMHGSTIPLVATAFDDTNYRAAAYLSVNFPDPSVPPHLDIDDLSVNEYTVPGGVLGLAANFMVRATGSGASCNGPAVPWLRVEGNIGVVVGGSATTLRFEVDPAAGQLPPGTHTAELCIVSNDPTQRTLSVPITLEVTAPLVAHSCSTTGDSLFCSGFDNEGADAIVRSGLLDRDLPPQGMSFNFVRADWGEFVLNGDDYALFHGGEFAPFMLFYWQGDRTPGRGGGVADTIFGPYQVLKSGDTIGPNSVFSEIAAARHAETRRFLEGVDGYLGVRFINEDTSQTNYGYIHLRTTWPSGYPAKVIDYAYDRTGAPITIP